MFPKVRPQVVGGCLGDAYKKIDRAETLRHPSAEYCLVVGLRKPGESQGNQVVDEPAHHRATVPRLAERGDHGVRPTHVGQKQHIAWTKANLRHFAVPTLEHVIQRAPKWPVTATRRQATCLVTPSHRHESVASRHNVDCPAVHVGGGRMTEAGTREISGDTLDASVPMCRGTRRDIEQKSLHPRPSRVNGRPRLLSLHGKTAGSSSGGSGQVIAALNASSTC